MKYLLAASLLINIWFGTAVARLENFHYATQLEINKIFVGDRSCGLYNDEIRRTAVGVCLEDKKLRTSEFWNLYHGLKIL